MIYENISWLFFYFYARKTSYPAENPDSKPRNNITGSSTRVADQTNFKFGELSLNPLETYKIKLFFSESLT